MYTSAFLYTVNKLYDRKMIKFKNPLSLALMGPAGPRTWDDCAGNSRSN
jgi:hypothetical protein